MPGLVDFVGRGDGMIRRDGQKEEPMIFLHDPFGVDRRPAILFRQASNECPVGPFRFDAHGFEPGE